MISPVLRQIARLQDCSQDELKAMWAEYFGVEPPAYRRGFLIRGLGQRIQELAHGGLAADYQRRLDALVEGQPPAKGTGRARTAHAGAAQRLAIGTRLIRDHQGVAHEATVVDGGFEYGGRLFKSLSAIARHITGTRWNGWAFFGLPNPAKRERAP
jgi:hypothetical protein